MRNMRVVFTVALMMACATGLAQAEPWSLVGNINMPFTAGGHALPAGEYTLIPDPELMVIRLEPPNGQAMLMPAITRLAMTPAAANGEARIVFDKVGDTYTLSEIWLPGEEGYLLHATNGVHTHHVLHFPLHLRK